MQALCQAKPHCSWVQLTKAVGKDLAQSLAPDDSHGDVRGQSQAATPGAGPRIRASRYHLFYSPENPGHAKEQLQPKHYITSYTSAFSSRPTSISGAPGAMQLQQLLK